MYRIGQRMWVLGIVTSCLGADTIITDQAHIVPLLEKNAQNIIARKEEYLRFGGSIECRHHNWGTPTDGATYDVIIASGVVYHEKLSIHFWLPLELSAGHLRRDSFSAWITDLTLILQGLAFPMVSPLSQRFRAIAQRVERQRTSSVS